VTEVEKPLREAAMGEDLERLKERIPLLQYLQRYHWTGHRVSGVGISRLTAQSPLIRLGFSQDAVDLGEAGGSEGRPKPSSVRKPFAGATIVRMATHMMSFSHVSFSKVAIVRHRVTFWLGTVPSSSSDEPASSLGGTPCRLARGFPYAKFAPPSKPQAIHSYSAFMCLCRRLRSCPCRVKKHQ
jgi:hypothetical protein